MTNWRVPLRTQVLLCAAMNLVLLLAGLAVLMWSQFDTGFESFLLAPTQAKLRSMGDRLVDDLVATPVERRGQLLAKYESEYGVQLGLFTDGGEALVGRLREFPPLVRRVLVPTKARPRPVEGGGEKRLPPPQEGAKRKKKGFDGSLPVGQRPHHPIMTVKDTGSYWFGIRMPVPVPGGGDALHGVLLVNTGSVLFNTKLFDMRPWLLGALVIAAMTMACWVPFVRSLTRSIHAMQEGAGKIASGQFDVRLPVERKDEVGQLGDALNHMAGQLKGLVHGQRRFLGDVAHELSAPLARMQASIGILQERAHPSMAKYVDRVAGEVTHMSELVHELLHFSKAGLATDAAARGPVVVSDVVARVLEREQAGEKVRLLEGGELAVMANEDGLFRALSNVVRNAVRYAGDDGPVTIAASREEGHVLVQVRDEGPGLPEEAVDQIFTPFYRVENSRSRESGGTGLGMAIVRTCVESSGGEVWCRNRKPRGLEVTLRLGWAGGG